MRHLSRENLFRGANNFAAFCCHSRTGPSQICNIIHYWRVPRSCPKQARTQLALLRAPRIITLVLPAIFLKLLRTISLALTRALVEVGRFLLLLLPPRPARHAAELSRRIASLSFNALGAWRWPVMINSSPLMPEAFTLGRAQSRHGMVKGFWRRGALFVQPFLSFLKVFVNVGRLFHVAY